jgi:hypothetical protein
VLDTKSLLVEAYPSEVKLWQILKMVSDRPNSCFMAQEYDICIDDTNACLLSVLNIPPSDVLVLTSVDDEVGVVCLWFTTLFPLCFQLTSDLSYPPFIFIHLCLTWSGVK